MTTFQKKTQEVSLRISLLIYLYIHIMDCVKYKYLFWYAFELQLTVFNVVPWLSTVPGIIAGGVLTRRLQSDGYSISYTRKVVEGICMITEAFCLFLIGKYIFFCSILSKIDVKHIRLKTNLITGQSTSYIPALILLVMCLFGNGFHNNSCVVNPQDLAPQNPGSIFGIMNACGSLPGKKCQIKICSFLF